MSWRMLCGGLAIVGLVGLLAGCSEGGEVNLMGENIAQASQAEPTAVQVSPVPPISYQDPTAAPPPIMQPETAPSLVPVNPPTEIAQAPAYPPTDGQATGAGPDASNGAGADASNSDSSAASPGWWPFPLPTEVPPDPPTAVPTLTPFPTATLPPTATPDPLENAGPPVQVQIPAIGVVALVEHVGLTKDGAMDTPKGWMNVGWFSQGFRPGEAGNSVIAGHLDSRSGGQAVFWNLNQLQPGDEVIVTYENGDQYTFAVQDVEVVPYDIQGPAVAAIFGPSQTADLNLITCNGLWDRGRATYTQRLVVYTTLEPEKTVHNGTVGGYD